MKQNSPEKQISDIYFWALLRINNINHKNIFSGSDGKKVFAFDESNIFNTAAKAFRDDITFIAIVDGITITIRPRSFARALQEIKSLIHS